MTLPADHARRRRFIEEVDRSFGVVAPAGVGKTQAIVERVARMAQAADATERLPRLVVVTYTTRAAGEMRRRARAHLMEANAPMEVQAAFNRAFFGTIHSFCLRLLRQHGHHLGVPARVQLLEDDADAWQRFLQDDDPLDDPAAPACAPEVLRRVSACDLLEMARRLSDIPEPPAPSGPPPEVDAREALAFTPKDKRSLGTVERSQAALAAALEAWRGDRFAPLPEREGNAKGFAEVWEPALAPLRGWLRGAVLEVAVHVARRYRDFRLRQGQLTFGDQIALAAELFGQPVAAAAIARERYTVLLDEAQDTDPLQFRVLCAAAGWDDVERTGALTMVGDPQQSIYGSRADVAVYRALQQRLAASPEGDALAFSVTFRCDRAVVEFANANFPAILDGAGGQVAYEPLEPRPAAAAGQVLRVPMEPGGEDERPEQAEARQVARWLRDAGLERLRASAWGRVAILCPRKRWFAPLAHALRAEGLPVQQQTFRECYGDHPAYAWLTALLWVLSHPRDGYELVGVLREVFALSDDALARYAQRDGLRWRLDAAPEGGGVVADHLRLLAGLRRDVAALPLGEAVRRVAEVTGLRERLAALPDTDSAETSALLDDLLIRLQALEARRATLLEAAEELREGMDSDREDRAPDPDAIHILTCQKAKGLEWDAVIVPYVFRAITFMRDAYPRLVRRPGARVPEVELSKEDVTAEGKDAERRELARLLYVTATRARHTLVWVDDEAVLGGKPGRSDVDFGRLLLGADEVNRERWQALGAEALADPAADRAQAELALDAEAAEPSGPQVDVALARLHASDFPQRTTPHALAKEPSREDPEARAERDEEELELPPATPGTAYGTWWHELMAEVPWAADAASWEAVFAQWQPRSPDPERAASEWRALRDSPVPALLAREGVAVQAEMPFLWRRAPEQVVEGVVDLAAYDAAADAWLILDWKTNRLPREDGMDRLAYLYAPQVEAYAQAFRGLFGRPVRQALYSTWLGELREW